MKKNPISTYLLLLLLLVSIFLTHSGHGDAANFSTRHENYWQFISTPTYLLPFFLLVIFLLLALFWQIKQAGKVVMMMVGLALVVHLAILLSAISPFFPALLQGRFASAAGIFFTYTWGLLIDLLLAVILLVMLVRKNIVKD
ncbi:hypothetical protein [Oenococcus sp.]|uniref:hypothetical protein n=1 Tax=Oenococcus sp. TaxID=1979414 RepID=UPI0039EC3526